MTTIVNATNVLAAKGISSRNEVGLHHTVSECGRPNLPPSAAIPAAIAIMKMSVQTHRAGVSPSGMRPGPIIHEMAQPIDASVAPSTAPAIAAIRTAETGAERATRYPVPA